MSTSQATITRVPGGEEEKKYINYLQAKNNPIITKYIVYDNLTDQDKILCVNPSSNEYVIYEAKLEKGDNYRKMKMLVEYLYVEKKYLIYKLK